MGSQGVDVALQSNNHPMVGSHTNNHINQQVVIDISSSSDSDDGLEENFDNIMNEQYMSLMQHSFKNQRTLNKRKLPTNKQENNKPVIACSDLNNQFLTPIFDIENIDSSTAPFLNSAATENCQKPFSHLGPQSWDCKINNNNIYINNTNAQTEIEIQNSIFDDDEYKYNNTDIINNITKLTIAPEDGPRTDTMFDSKPLPAPQFQLEDEIDHLLLTTKQYPTEEIQFTQSMFVSTNFWDAPIDNFKIVKIYLATVLPTIDNLITRFNNSIYYTPINTHFFQPRYFSSNSKTDSDAKNFLDAAFTTPSIQNMLELTSTYITNKVRIEYTPCNATRVFYDALSLFVANCSANRIQFKVLLVTRKNQHKDKYIVFIFMEKLQFNGVVVSGAFRREYVANGNYHDTPQQALRDTCSVILNRIPQWSNQTALKNIKYYDDSRLTSNSFIANIIKNTLYYNIIENHNFCDRKIRIHNYLVTKFKNVNRGLNILLTRVLFGIHFTYNINCTKHQFITSLISWDDTKYLHLTSTYPFINTVWRIVREFVVEYRVIDTYVVNLLARKIKLTLMKYKYNILWPAPVKNLYNLLAGQLNKSLSKTFLFTSIYQYLNVNQSPFIVSNNSYNRRIRKMYQVPDTPPTKTYEYLCLHATRRINHKNKYSLAEWLIAVTASYQHYQSNFLNIRNKIAINNLRTREKILEIIQQRSDCNRGINFAYNNLIDQTYRSNIQINNALLDSEDLPNCLQHVTDTDLPKILERAAELCMFRRIMETRNDIIGTSDVTTL